MQILGWLCEDSCTAMLRFACADALAALAADSTDVGLGIARAWLGDLLVHLTRNVKAHHSIRQVKPCYASVKQAWLQSRTVMMPYPHAMSVPTSFLFYCPVTWLQIFHWLPLQWPSRHPESLKRFMLADGRNPVSWDTLKAAIIPASNASQVLGSHPSASITPFKAVHSTSSQFTALKVPQRTCAQKTWHYSS